MSHFHSQIKFDTENIKAQYTDKEMLEYLNIFRQEDAEFGNNPEELDYVFGLEDVDDIILRRPIEII